MCELPSRHMMWPLAALCHVSTSTLSTSTELTNNLKHVGALRTDYSCAARHYTLTLPERPTPRRLTGPPDGSAYNPLRMLVAGSPFDHGSGGVDRQPYTGATLRP